MAGAVGVFRQAQGEVGRSIANVVVVSCGRQVADLPKTNHEELNELTSVPFGQCRSWYDDASEGLNEREAVLVPSKALRVGMGTAEDVGRLARAGGVCGVVSGRPRNPLAVAGRDLVHRLRRCAYGCAGRDLLREGGATEMAMGTGQMIKGVTRLRLVRQGRN